MEKSTKLNRNLDRMVAELEAHSINDPLVKMILEEVSEMYGSSANPDFQIHYLDSPLELKYGVHFASEIFYVSYAAMIAQICRNIGVDSFRRSLEEAMELRGIVEVLNPAEITALLFSELWETTVPYEVGIQVAVINYPSDQLSELEGELRDEFRENFSQPYDYGDPDYVEELARRIKIEFETRDQAIFHRRFRTAMFKRILDRSFPHLFYRWIVRGNKPTFKGVLQLNDYLFGDS